MNIFCDRDGIGLTHNANLNKFINMHIWGECKSLSADKNNISFALLQEMTKRVVFGNFVIAVVSVNALSKLITDQAALRVFDSTYRATGIMAMELDFLGSCPIRVVYNPALTDDKILLLEYEIKNLSKDKFNLGKPSKVTELYDLELK